MHLCYMLLLRPAQYVDCTWHAVAKRCSHQPVVPARPLSELVPKEKVGGLPVFTQALCLVPFTMPEHWSGPRLCEDLPGDCYSQLPDQHLLVRIAYLHCAQKAVCNKWQRLQHAEAPSQHVVRLGGMQFLSKSAHTSHRCEGC